MPPKLKKAAQDLKTCDLCAGDIKVGEEPLQCTGSCQTLVNRYCAGVTIKHYKQLLDTSSPFVCLYCSQKAHVDKMNTLQSELDSLKQALSQVQLDMSSSQDSLKQALPQSIRQCFPQRTTD